MLLGPIWVRQIEGQRIYYNCIKFFSNQCKKERDWCTKLIACVGRWSAVYLCCWCCISLYYICNGRNGQAIIPILSLRSTQVIIVQSTRETGNILYFAWQCLKHGFRYWLKIRDSVYISMRGTHVRESKWGLSLIPFLWSGQ